MKSFFGGVGNIVKFKDTCTYHVNSLGHIIEKILTHFDHYPLVTQKLADYILFKEIVILMNNKEHVTLEGLNKIISLRASLNLGLSENLKDKFPEIKAVVRPLILDKEVPNPE